MLKCVVFQEDTQTKNQSYDEEGAQKLSNFDKGTSYNHSFTGVIANKDRLPNCHSTLNIDITKSQNGLPLKRNDLIALKSFI